MQAASLIFAKPPCLRCFSCCRLRFLIPNTLFEDELLSFTDNEKKTLLDGGLKVVDLPGSQVSRARDVIRAQPRLSIHDGFAFALAEVNRGCILLTGDSLLRSLAETSQIEVHGVLWVFDQILTHELATPETLHAALSQLAADPAVRLPKRDVAAYIKRYEGSK